MLKKLLDFLLGEKCLCCKLNRLKAEYTRLHKISTCPTCNYKKVVKR